MDDILEYFRRKLFALIVPDDADLDLLFVSEILVIVHLASDEGVGPLCDGLVEHEVPCPTADGHLPYRPL